MEDLTNIDKVGKLDLTSNKEKNKKNQSLEARADAFSRLTNQHFQSVYNPEPNSL